MDQQIKRKVVGKMKSKIDKSAIFFLLLSLFALLVDGYSFGWFFVAIINTILICMSLNERQKTKGNEQTDQMDQNIQNKKDNQL